MTGGADEVVAAVVFAEEQLTRGENWADHIDEVLARLGSAAQVDRAYLYQNLRDPTGRLWMDLWAEWDRPGVGPIFEIAGNHLHPYAPDLARWIEVLGTGQRVQGSVAALPDAERLLLDKEGVASILVVPVTARGEWWGFVGFDDCRRARVWSVPE